MRFAIEADNGSEIRGWLVPENQLEPAEIVVSAPGQPETRLRADLPRPDIRDRGLATSEFVGFFIDRTLAPGLEAGGDIELFEAASGAPIYRRTVPAGCLDRKLLFFDSAAVPQRSLVRGLSAYFATTCANAERFSAETLSTLFANPMSRSIAFCGRPRLAAQLGALEGGGFVRVALLHDPLEELAERLLFLNLLGRSAPEALIGRLASGLESLVGFAAQLRFDDYKALLGDFRRLTEVQRRALISPMVWSLGCSSVGPPIRDDVSRALDNLASFDVVGVRSNYLGFRSTLVHFLGADVLGSDDRAASEQVRNFSALLSRIGVAVDLLADDIALYADVQAAVESGMDGREEMAERSN